MPNTFSDFWRMVWEQKLVTIVMLTKCTEAGKVQCDMYLMHACAARGRVIALSVSMSVGLSVWSLWTQQ